MRETLKQPRNETVDSSLSREDGFTLTEVLVAIALMTMVVFALYSMFDMSLRVFGTGNSKVEASQNARVALDRMEREIRSAWHSESNCDSSSDTGDLLDPSSGPSSIAVWNCSLNYGPPTSISYQMNGNVLYRTEEDSAPQPLATLGTAETPLAFNYLDATGNNSVPPEEAVLVEVTLVARDEDQDQTLITNAGLRNAN